MSPRQLHAIELRLEGLGIAQIALQVGQHRATISRWFNRDTLVIAELAKRLEELHQEEHRRHANIRQKALLVVESAIDEGDLRTALAVLRLPGPAPTARSSSTGSVVYTPGSQDTFDEGVTSAGWQLLIEKTQELLGSAGTISDDNGVLDQLLLLDQAAGYVADALELAEGEGLTGFASVSASEQAARLADARRTMEDAFEKIGGDDEDQESEGGLPGWPGDEQVNQAIELQARAFVEMLDSLEGAEEELTRTVGTDEAARIAGRLSRALEAANGARGSRSRALGGRIRRVGLLTDSLLELMGALGAAVSIEVENELDGSGGLAEKSRSGAPASP